MLALGAYLSAGAVVHRPRTDRQLNFRLSFPRAPAGTSESARCGRDDDDSLKPTWQKETFQ